MTETETGLKQMLVGILGVSIEGSVASQKENEWSSSKDAGRWSDSRIVKISQKRWNLWRPET